MSRQQKLRIVLWIAALACMSGIFGVILPWSWLAGWMRLWGIGILPATPLVVYAIRTVSATFVFVGLFHVLAAQDTVRYAPLVNLAIGAWLTVGLVCLLTGIAVGMRPPWYVMDVASCWVVAGLMLRWRGR